MKKKFFYFVPLLIFILILLFRILNWAINFPSGKIIRWLIISTLICSIAPLMIFMKKKMSAAAALCISIFLLSSQILNCSNFRYHIKRNILSIKYFYYTYSYVSGSQFVQLIKYPYKSEKVSEVERQIFEKESAIRRNEKIINQPANYSENQRTAKERKEQAKRENEILEEEIKAFNEQIQSENMRTRNIARYYFFRIFDEGSCILLAFICLIISIIILNDFSRVRKKQIFCLAKDVVVKLKVYGIIVVTAEIC